MTIPLLIILFQFHFDFGWWFYCRFQLLICQFWFYSAFDSVWFHLQSFAAGVGSFAVFLIIHLVSFGHHSISHTIPSFICRYICSLVIRFKGKVVYLTTIYLFVRRTNAMQCLEIFYVINLFLMNIKLLYWWFEYLFIVTMVCVVCK